MPAPVYAGSFFRRCPGGRCQRQVRRPREYGVAPDTAAPSCPPRIVLDRSRRIPWACPRGGLAGWAEIPRLQEANVSPSSRREFLVTSIGGLAAGAACGGGARAQDAKPEQPTLAALERRKLGKTELTVGVLGFGAAEMGYARTDMEVVERMLSTALDQGLDAIDTAECY